MAYFAVNSVAEMAQSEVTASLPGDTDKQTEGPLDERGNSTAMQTDDQGACDLPSAPCDPGLQRKMATKPSHGNRQRPRWAAEGHVGGRHIAHRWRPERRSTLFRGLRPRIHRRTVLRMSWGLRNFRKRCLGRSRCIWRDPQTYSCMFGARSKHICLHTHTSQPYLSYTLPRMAPLTHPPPPPPTHRRTHPHNFAPPPPPHQHISLLPTPTSLPTPSPHFLSFSHHHTIAPSISSHTHTAKRSREFSLGGHFWYEAR